MNEFFLQDTLLVLRSYSVKQDKHFCGDCRIVWFVALNVMKK